MYLPSFKFSPVKNLQVKKKYSELGNGHLVLNIKSS